MPLVFSGELYATAALSGAVTMIPMIRFGVEPGHAALVGMTVIFLVRIAALRWHIPLPTLGTRQ